MEIILLCIAFLFLALAAFVIFTGIDLLKKEDWEKEMHSYKQSFTEMRKKYIK